MKKKILPLIFALSSSMFFSQYLIVGNDSISVKDYVKDNKYGLEKNGVDKSINSTIEFLLLQQLARDKKADTLNFFRNSVAQKISEIKQEKFYPKEILEPMLQDFVKQNNTERQILLFVKEKSAEDKNDYNALYTEVKQGKVTMEDFLAKHGNPQSSKAFYVKPGMLDYSLYQQVAKTPVGSYTELINKPNAVSFAKIVNTRPSLGYMVFGVLSIPKDDKYEATKAKIYQELQNGKSFQAVVKEFGSSDDEKNSGGAVMGSPILPDEVYTALKGQIKDFYTKEPILFGDKYFIFNIYSLQPYVLTQDNRSFFQKEMMESSYGQETANKLVDWLKKTNQFSENKNLAEIKKSYQSFLSFKNPEAVLFSYNKKNVTYEDFKSIIDKQYKDLDKSTPAQWAEIVDYQVTQNIFGSYSVNFENLADVKPTIDEFKRNLFSEYVFSEYLKNELVNHPELYSDYYNKNKEKFLWEKRAQSRAVVISDPKLVKEIEKDIKDPAKWKALQEKYKNKLNEKNMVLVHFEEGKVPESSELFTKNNVPFKKGNFQTKISNRDVLVAIDEILPPQTMTLDEAKPEMEDAVTELFLQKTIANQRQKTKIDIQPAFTAELYKNFKK